MTRGKRLFGVFILTVLVASIVLGYATTKAATKVLKPTLKVVQNPGTEYKVGERITFKVSSPNYGGAVEYRVILWNGNLKEQSELWPKMPGYYYQNWKPSGSFAFPITWIVTNDMKPGPYRLTVLTRRAGSKVSYDSYVNLPVFWVRESSEAVISSISELKSTINEGDSYSLPGIVTAKMSDGTSKSVSVKWDKAVDTSKAGIFIYEGTVNGYSGRVKLTLTVNGVPFRVESVY